VLELSLTDGADKTIFFSHYCHLKDLWLVIKQLTINVKEVMFQELLIMQKYMDWLTKIVLLTIQVLQLQNNAKKRLKNAKNIKLRITVFQKKFKTLNKRSLITVQSSLSFQFTEIFSSIEKVFIKFTQETKDFQLDKL